MQTRRMVWTMLAVSIYLGLFSTDTGPTQTVEAGDSENLATSGSDDCIVVGGDGRVTVYPGDCGITTGAPLTA